MSEDPLKLERAITSSGGGATLRLQIGQSEYINLKLLEWRLADCPAYFFIALADNDPADPPWTRVWQASAGRGFERAAAHKSAIYEAIERACLISSGEEDPRVTRTPRRGIPRLTAQELSNYSADELHDLFAKAKNITTEDCCYPVDKLWVRGQRLATFERVFVSATAALFNEDIRLGLPPAFSTSTGTAVRSSLEGAKVHAVLELVERDLVAIWWYSRLPAPRLDPAFAAAALPAELAAWLARRGRLTWHLALPGDLPATAVVALSARADGSRPAIGAAAALDAVDAVRAATLELLQCEITLGHMRAAQQLPDPPPLPPLLAWSAATNALATPYLAGAGPAAAPPSPVSFETLSGHFATHGIDVVTVDLTRPELGVPVAKALSPQLRDWLPRFGPGRLYDVPVALGLRSAPAARADLNPTPFVI